MSFKTYSKQILKSLVVGSACIFAGQVHAMVSPGQSFGLYGIMKAEHRHLSPLIGQIYADTWLENMYKFGNNNLVIQEKGNRQKYVKREAKLFPETATHGLIELLFHAIPNISGVVPSVLTDRPSLYLTPYAIGKMLSWIEKVRGISCDLIIKAYPKIVDDAARQIRKKIQKEKIYVDKQTKIAQVNQKIVQIRQNQKKNSLCIGEQQLKDLCALQEKLNDEMELVKKERELQLSCEFYDQCKSGAVKDLLDLCDENVVIKIDELLVDGLSHVIKDAVDEYKKTLPTNELVQLDKGDQLCLKDGRFIQLILKSLLESGELKVNTIAIEIKNSKNEKAILKIEPTDQLIKGVKEKLPILKDAQFLLHTVGNIFLILLNFKAHAIEDYEKYFKAFGAGQDSLLLAQYDDFWEDSTSLSDVLDRYRKSHENDWNKFNEIAKTDIGYGNKLEDACKGRFLTDCFDLIACTELSKRYPHGVPQKFKYAYRSVEVIIDGEKTVPFSDCAETAFLNFMCLCFTKLGLFDELHSQFDMSEKKLTSATALLLKRESMLQKAQEEQKSIDEIKKIEEPTLNEIQVRLQKIVKNKEFVEFFKAIYRLSEKDRHSFWAQLVSNLPGVEYKQKDHELAGASAQNFVALCNYFLGTDCILFDDLCSIFEIYDSQGFNIFSMESDSYDGELKWCIKDGLNLNIRALFINGHGEFYVKSTDPEFSELTTNIFGSRETGAINLIPLYGMVSNDLFNRMSKIEYKKGWSSSRDMLLPLLKHLVYSYNLAEMSKQKPLIMQLFDINGLYEFCGLLDKKIDPKIGLQRASFEHFLARSVSPSYVKEQLRDLKEPVQNKIINEVDDYDGNPLQYAVASGSLAAIRWLVDRGAKTNVTYNNKTSLLHYAAVNGRLDVVKWLVNEAKVDVNSKDNALLTPLHLAVVKGYLDGVKWLVTQGKADVNAHASNGSTPLHFAAQKGYFEIVMFLVDIGEADAFAKNHDGDSALHMAAKKGHFDVVKLLIDKVNLLVGDSLTYVNAKNCYGDTALHMAVKKRHFDVVKLLVSCFRANVNQKNCKGNTPLHVATKKGYLDLVKWLVTECKANPHIRTFPLVGSTVFDVAEELGHEEIIKYLRTYMIPNGNVMCPRMNEYYLEPLTWSFAKLLKLFPQIYNPIYQNPKEL